PGRRRSAVVGLPPRARRGGRGARPAPVPSLRAPPQGHRGDGEVPSVSGAAVHAVDQVRSIGRSVLRNEDPALLRGRARFVDDLAEPGALEAAVLRSPHAHARLRAIDVSAALELDGVVDVVTAADLPGGGPLIPIRMFSRPGMERFLQRPLALDRVRYVGEPMAVVVADSRYVAEDALEQITVEYEPLEAVQHPEEAVQPGAPLLHEDAGTNVAAAFDIESGDVDGAFEGAHAIVEATFACGSHAAVPLETRGLVAEVEPAGGRLVVHGVAKVVHG